MQRACIVPCLDAASTLPALLDGLRASLPDAVIIGVNDGSADGTAAVLEQACDRVITFPVNRGKGAALREGLRAALEIGASRVLTIDADGQHDPSFAPLLLSELERADVVVGVRSRTRSLMPLRRRLTNALSSAAIAMVAGCRLPDTQSGYRAIRRCVLETVAAEGDRYEFETDFLIRAARQRYRISSVTVPTLYGPPSHFRELTDGARVIATIWRHRQAVAR